ncbi:amino acid ABC transporter substrate-binding protein [Streptococcus minor]|uniref:Amino acid ABC transporter substrate-binding protein n=1 Tax=Streptococcus minor TaxID=229549 RepID=A0A3P1VEI2_9STRE|nr:transporter substrate-binding domain-containing protein [Streptococcus minor]RRD31865.1 amino acid ABC transporter substrate-binding protein [Streptococcus minor]
MKIKKIVLGLATAFSALALTACGGSAGKTDSLAAIKEKGKLVVAVSPDYAPFEFRALVDGKDTVVGSDIDLAQDIADELGVELELSTMNFDNVLSSVQNGKADIAISGLSYTGDRAKVYDFSESYYTTENAILVAADKVDNYKTLDDFSGKSVGVLKGSIEEGLSKEQLKGANIVALPVMGDAIAQLKAGQLDAVVLEAPVGAGYISQNADIAMSELALTVAEGDAKVVAMPKDSPELKKAIDKVVVKLVEDGTYKDYILKAAELTGSAIEE